MDELTNFITTYGFGWISLFAVVGIVLLGIMKYCNLFKKITEENRHYLYLVISIGFSVVATLVYLLIVGQFSWATFLGIAIAVFALNQTFYNFFKITPVNKWGSSLLDLIKALFEKAKTDENATDEMSEKK